LPLRKLGWTGSRSEQIRCCEITETFIDCEAKSIDIARIFYHVVLHDHRKKGPQLGPIEGTLFFLLDRELATRIGLTPAYCAKDLRKGCGLSKSLLLRDNHRQATSSQNLTKRFAHY
jgi:hypothetical protein